jgi:hypothetical protein
MVGGRQSHRLDGCHIKINCIENDNGTQRTESHDIVKEKAK